jgi:hypothetical protein
MEMDLKEIWLKCGLDPLGSEYVLVAGSCGRDNDSSSGLLASQEGLYSVDLVNCHLAWRAERGFIFLLNCTKNL